VKIANLSSGGKCVLKLDSSRIDVGTYTSPASYGRNGAGTCSTLRGTLRLSGLVEGKAVECAKLQLIK
jgi:hypothetical protein